MTHRQEYSEESGEEPPEAFLKEVDRLKQDLAGMRADMTQKDQMLAEQRELLSRQEVAIRHLEQGFKSKSEELVQVCQQNETPQLRGQLAELRDELLWQQVGDLQGRLNKVEHFIAQVSIADCGFLVLRR